MALKGEIDILSPKLWQKGEIMTYCCEKKCFDLKSDIKNDIKTDFDLY